ncbi:MAG: alpha/beta fold hydrolase [Angustibacter sp.]
MPTANVNGVTLNYELTGEGPETIVLINGLADDIESWGFQVPDFVDAGYRVLTIDNRGIGKSDAPEGPYTSRMLADDAKAVVDQLGITGFHLMGVSMGGMISQEYALAYPDDLKSATFACTYAAPGPFCSRMFAMWGDMAPQLGVPFVMRDVTLWAFTVPFFTQREDELKEFEEGMAALPMSVDAYLSQLNVIQTHDTRDRIGSLTVPCMVLAGEEDILIPTRLSKELHDLIPGAQWRTVPGGHACLWETPGPFNQAYLDFVRSHS